MIYLCATCGAEAPDDTGCLRCSGPTFSDTPGGREQMRSYRLLGADRFVSWSHDLLGFAVIGLSYPLWAALFYVFLWWHENPFALAQLPAIGCGVAAGLIQRAVRRYRRPSAEAALEQRLGLQEPPAISMLRAPSFWLAFACLVVTIHLCGSPWLVDALACRPAELRHGVRLWTLVTSLAAHPTLADVVANGFFLVWIARGVEEHAAPLTVVGLFVLGGVAGKLAYTALGGSASLILGASGGVMAIAGAHVALDPWRAFVIDEQPRLALPALLYIPALVAVMGLVDYASHPWVAWQSHAGGFVAGLVLGAVVRLGRRVRAVAPAAVSA